MKVNAKCTELCRNGRCVHYYMHTMGRLYLEQTGQRYILSPWRENVHRRVGGGLYQYYSERELMDSASHMIQKIVCHLQCLLKRGTLKRNKCSTTIGCYTWKAVYRNSKNTLQTIRVCNNIFFSSHIH